MHFLIEYEELLKKYNDIWDKVSNSTRNEIDSKPAYNKKFLKTKLKPYCNEATVFHMKNITKVGSHYTCLVVILINFIF